MSSDPYAPAYDEDDVIGPSPGDMDESEKDEEARHG